MLSLNRGSTQLEIGSLESLVRNRYGTLRVLKLRAQPFILLLMNGRIDMANFSGRGLQGRKTRPPLLVVTSLSVPPNIYVTILVQEIRFRKCSVKRTDQIKHTPLDCLVRRESAFLFIIASQTHNHYVS
jgi:hypothetical protein